MSAELDGEGYTQMREAMDNPARVEFTVIGQDGYKVVLGYPIGAHEDAEITVTTDIHRNEYRSGWFDPQPYYEPIPTGRTITWTLETKTVRVPEAGL
jgi:hypothetical protein